MNPTTFIALPALTLVSALALPVGLEAQPQSPRYIVVDLGKPGLGGPSGVPTSPSPWPTPPEPF